jgi:hypothetical protein
MELTIVMRLRIFAAMAAGAILLGFLGWPLVKPSEPLSAVTLFSGDITVIDTIICLLLAYIVGIVAYFISHPYGKQIAPLAAPTGLAVWGIRSGDMASLLRTNYSLQQRQQLYAILKWEGFFWLLIVAAGMAGVCTAARFIKSKPDSVGDSQSANFNFHKALTVITALVATVVIAQFAIGIFARDVKMFDTQLGSVTGQPHVAQIAFAIILSFGIAAFILRAFLGTGYIITTISASLLIVFTTKMFAKQDILEHMTKTWPVVFFPHSICAILPIQTISFAAIGSIAGYWIAIQYLYSRKHRGQTQKA